MIERKMAEGREGEKKSLVSWGNFEVPLFERGILGDFRSFRSIKSPLKERGELEPDTTRDLIQPPGTRGLKSSRHKLLRPSVRNRNRVHE